MAQIDRASATALVNQQYTGEIWQEAAQQSVALATFRKINMTSTQAKLAVLSTLPAAPGGGPFVSAPTYPTGQGTLSSDQGRKPTLTMAWANKFLNVEEIAGIVPIPENVLDDSAFDIWGEVRPRIAEYVAAAVDAAVFKGTGAPASWPSGGIVAAAVAAGNVLSTDNYPGGNTLTNSNQAAGTPTTSTSSHALDRGDLYNDAIGLVEDDGFDPNFVTLRRAERRKLRALRDFNGQFIYSDGLKSSSEPPSVWGVPLSYIRTGGLGAYAANLDTLAVVGDASYGILGLRQDMTFKFLDQATLTDGNGVVTFSLAENDMVALRFKIRLAFQIANPTTFEGGSSAFPFAVVRRGNTVA